MRSHIDWRLGPSSIPTTEAGRIEKAQRERQQAFGEITDETRRIDRSRQAEKDAEIHGVSGLFGS